MTHLGIKEEVSGSDELEFFMFDMSFTKATGMIKYIISDYYNYDPDDDMFGKWTKSTRSQMMKLIKQPVLFQRPKLLKPPNIFRDLLKYYMKNDIGLTVASWATSSHLVVSFLCCLLHWHLPLHRGAFGPLLCNLLMQIRLPYGKRKGTSLASI